MLEVVPRGRQRRTRWFVSGRRRHTRCLSDWSSDVCSSDLWVKTAVRGDWVKHLNFYADRVDYFQNRKMARAEVGSRKLRTFGGLDSYSLKFTQSPQVSLRQVDGGQEADVSFDKQWRLMRGRKVKPITGVARGMITLRREPRGGWRIVSEKQIKK